MKLEPIADYRKRLERWKTKYAVVCHAFEDGNWFAERCGHSAVASTHLSACKLSAEQNEIPLPPKRKVIKS